MNWIDGGPILYPTAQEPILNPESTGRVKAIPEINLAPTRSLMETRDR